MKGRTFGNPEAGQLLKAARSAAGFTSAKAACLNYGWSEPSMRAHESGTRKISSSDAQKYAEAFGLPVQAFMRSADANIEITKLNNSEHGARSKAHSMAGARLKLARKIRGFATAFDFSVRFGFKLPTLGSHEAGINSVSEAMAEAYAFALGISTSWLLRGELPSGFGEAADAHLTNSAGSTAFDVEALSRWATPAPLLDVGRLSELIENAKTRRPAGNSEEDIVFEIQLPSPTSGSETVHMSRSWKLPKGFTRSVMDARASDTVVVAVPHSVDDLMPGDRLFLDRSKRDPMAGGEFAYANGEGRLVLRSGSQDDTHHLLGKVVARFVRAKP